MIIRPDELRKNWNVVPRAVLHVGAHEAEESPLYESLDWSPVIWVEAQPNLAEGLRKNLDPRSNRVIEAAIWDVSGKKMSLHVTSNSQSTSLLNLGTHSKTYPNISVVGEIEVETKRLDELIDMQEMPDFINLDIQGVELRALESLGNLLKRLNYIYLEVNWREVYKDCAKVWEVDRYLSTFGFHRATTRWFIRPGWGDALYLNNKVKKRSINQRYKNARCAFRFYYPQRVALFSKMFRKK